MCNAILLCITFQMKEIMKDIVGNYLHLHIELLRFTITKLRFIIINSKCKLMNLGLGLNTCSCVMIHFISILIHGGSITTF
jgi:hypothetical protein